MVRNEETYILPLVYPLLQNVNMHYTLFKVQLHEMDAARKDAAI